MGKKLKKRTRHGSGHKDNRPSAVSPLMENHVNQKSKLVEENTHVSSSKLVEENTQVSSGNLCRHANKAVNFSALSSKNRRLGVIRCEDCSKDSERKERKGKGKQGRNKGLYGENSDSNSVWVCLACGHMACGGETTDFKPHHHAFMHWKYLRHPYALQRENPFLCWCFNCNRLITVDISGEREILGDDKERDEDKGNSSDLLKALKLINDMKPKGSRLDVEDVWFGNNVGAATQLESSNSALLDTRKECDIRSGYVVKGLQNLGNTCFFNSVLQNLLALGSLRDHFLNMNHFNGGPLSSALKKLFCETCFDPSEKGGPKESKNWGQTHGILNPKSLFGNICSKAPQFRGYQQQDSHELLRCLLDALSTEDLVSKKSAAKSNSGEDEENGPLNVDVSFVDGIFGGRLSSTLCCSECGRSSTVYEPFLDLSLPVPAKKPTKKAPIARPKKLALGRPGKASLKESRKGRRDQEKGNSFIGPIWNPSAGIGLSSECSEGSSVPSNPVVKEEETVAPEESVRWLDYIEDPKEDSSCVNAPEESFCWLDYIKDPKDGSSCLDASESKPKCSFSHCDGDTTKRNPETGLVVDNRDTSSYSAEPKHEDPKDSSLEKSETNSCLPNGEPKIGCDSSGDDNEFIDDGEPLVIGDSEVLLLPYKEMDSTEEGILSDPQEPDTLLNGYGLNGDSSSVVLGCEKGADEFDGLGDLFNEPEIVSDPKKEPGSGGNNMQFIDEFVTQDLSETEFNQEEVDNTDAPVSVEICLADFTKPELLTGVHGFNCEGCSKALNHNNNRETKVLEDQVNGANGSESMESEASLDALETQKSRLINGSKGSLPFEPEESSINRRLPADVSDCSSNLDKRGCNESFCAQNCDDLCSSGCDSASSRGSDGCNLAEKSKREKYMLSGRTKNAEKRKDGQMECFKRDGTKRFLISKAPPVLTIHLKRFSQDARGRLSKLNGHVNFREMLELRPYMDRRCPDKDSSLYSLVGVVEHSGSMRGGHYVAYVRGPHSRDPQGLGEYSWFYASDVNVSRVSLTEVLKSEAYILFYEKCIKK
ncbi:ubiquitin carboxyl-terminal hydrolase 2 [Amborella trichopoda]|uniref:Uncharacterized protein n=1 Tax=Amborella trichopoda TaxID=13333 RepID=W1PVV9_AMBTC|nr:ubiquitin carboxyl-terminal hydrolase 2 [Amborella trichopoda]XP_020526578.1 ubiquitin carboxyl-terminal hydrolase 2 [Amborella trichopoda]ERN11851.1 hypothetical protein AMTR_s00020p00108940 [Amborella trichopoda]|eukprot:XP_020526577.1 ubiquitin carboxyl-terminal hydrolase 2 [Amborella trichopoda]